MITPYYAKYFVHELTLAAGKGLDRISQSLYNTFESLNLLNGACLIKSKNGGAAE